MDLDAVSLVKDPNRAHSAAAALRVRAITRLAADPLRLRLAFQDAYLLSVATLDVSVP